MAVEELTNPVFSPYVDTLTLFIPNIQLGGLGIFWRFRAGFKSSFARCLVLQRSTYSKWIGVTWKIQSEKKSRPHPVILLQVQYCFVCFVLYTAAFRLSRALGRWRCRDSCLLCGGLFSVGLSPSWQMCSELFCSLLSPMLLSARVNRCCELATSCICMARRREFLESQKSGTWWYYIILTHHHNSAGGPMPVAIRQCTGCTG